MRNSKLPENRPRLGLVVGYLGDLRGSLSLEALTERLGAFVVSQNLWLQGSNQHIKKLPRASLVHWNTF